MKPKCRTAGNLIQLRYGIPHDVQSSLVYPLTSPNGSSIIVSGHSAGLFITWRGGYPLKEPTASSATPKSPPASLKPQTSSDVMIIDLDDSDDEDSKPTAVVASDQAVGPPEPAIFDDEEAEPDLRQPYPPLVQTLNLPVAGGGITHIAAPLLSNAVRRSLLEPSVLRTHMVLALSCADAVVRLLLLPLAPPSNQAKTRKELIERPQMERAGMGSWGETLVEIPRSLGHTTLVDGLAVGLSPRQLIVDDVADGGDTTMQIQGTAERDDIDLESWDVLIASASADAGGTLLVHRIPVMSDGRNVEEDDVQLWRSVFLRRPATAVDLHPGSATRVPSYPKVLVAEADGPVRIYECSNEETKDEGGWLGQLFADGEAEDETKSNSGRILSARFILGGYAVAALTSGGEWGVWNISIPSDVEFNQHSFSYKSRLFTSSASVSKSLKATSALSKPPRPSSLAPMTPHTRKVRQRELFANDSASENKPRGSTSASDIPASRGGIELTLTSHEPNSPAEDAHALLWYGSAAVFVPNLRAHHLSYLSSSSSPDLASALTSGNDLFTSATSSVPAQPRQIISPDPGSLCGGLCVGAAILPTSSSLRAAGVRTKVPEIAVVSERAFSIVGYPLATDGAAVRTKAKPRSDDKAEDGVSGLLTSGIASAGEALSVGAELAIDGIENMLDRMAGSARRLSGRA